MSFRPLPRPGQLVCRAAHGWVRCTAPAQVSAQMPGAGPVAAWRRCLAGTFRYSGRASRSEYWWAWLVVVGPTLAVELGRLLRVLVPAWRSRERNLSPEEKQRRLRAVRQELAVRRRTETSPGQGPSTQSTPGQDRKDPEGRQSSREQHRQRAWYEPLHPVTAVWLVATGPGLWAAGIRRLHDTNRSGWWSLVGLLPFIGPALETWLLSRPSDAAGTRFDRS